MLNFFYSKNKMIKDLLVHNTEGVMNKQNLLSLFNFLSNDLYFINPGYLSTFNFKLRNHTSFV